MDGAQVGASTPAVGAITYGLATSNDLMIGQYPGTCSLPFDGDVDEVEIFDRALSPGEISALYVADSAGKCKTGACCIGLGTLNTPAECIEVTEEDCLGQGGLALGNGVSCDVIDCLALLVTYESISATATADGVRVSWVTEMEIDTVGFRVLRGSERKTLTVLSDLIPSAGYGVTGASYEFLDNSELRPGRYAYYVEDIDIYGKVTQYGPMFVDVPAETESKPRVSPERRLKDVLAR